MSYLRPVLSALASGALAAGKVRPLGISSTFRVAEYPDIPPLSEVGVPGYDAVSWQMIVASAKTPRPIIDRLHAEMVKAVNDPAVKDRLVKSALEPATSTPEQLAAQTRSGYDKIAKIIKDANIKAD